MNSEGRLDLAALVENHKGSEHIVKAISVQFNDREMSDLQLKVGDQTFYVHKFVLSLLSDVFRTMCSKRWEEDSDKSVLEIHECEECIPVFDDFLKYLYSGYANIHVTTAFPLLMLADKYNVQPLKDLLEEFMKNVVYRGSIEQALQWSVYAQLSSHEALQFSCLDVIISKMDEVVSSEKFLQLEIGFLVTLLGRDDLVIFWEKVLYIAVVQWIDAQTEVKSDEIHLLMKLIRFSMMLPEQLYEIESSQFYSTYKAIMAPIINTAHRFRSLATDLYDMPGLSDPIFRPRNYVHRLWCHYITVETNGDTFFQDSVGIQCVNHPVASGVEQFWQVKIIGEKKMSGNLAFSKPTMLPNLLYTSSSMGSSAVKTIPLTLAITPLKPIKQNVAVDISLYQVKRDRLSRFLCSKTLEFSPCCIDDQDDNILPSCGFSCRHTSSMEAPPAFSAPQFNPSPINLSIKIRQARLTVMPEITLRYNFVSEDFDHPAEIPCFQFQLNGPRRSTNSIRVALIFKPRFMTHPIKDDNEVSQSDNAICDSSPSYEIADNYDEGDTRNI